MTWPVSSLKSQLSLSLLTLAHLHENPDHVDSGDADFASHGCRSQRQLLVARGPLLMYVTCVVRIAKMKRLWG